MAFAELQRGISARRSMDAALGNCWRIIGLEVVTDGWTLK
jgi:hypothetical protein